MSFMWVESLANAPLHAIACAADAGFGAAPGAPGAAAGAVAVAPAGGELGRGAVAASSPGIGLSAGDTERAGAVRGFGFTAGTVCTWRGEICSSGDRGGWFWARAGHAPRAAAAVRPASRMTRRTCRVMSGPSLPLPPHGQAHRDGPPRATRAA